MYISIYLSLSFSLFLSLSLSSLSLSLYIYIYISPGPSTESAVQGLGLRVWGLGLEPTPSESCRESLRLTVQRWQARGSAPPRSAARICRGSLPKGPSSGPRNSLYKGFRCIRDHTYYIICDSPLQEFPCVIFFLSVPGARPRRGEGPAGGRRREASEALGALGEGLQLRGATRGSAGESCHAKKIDKQLPCKEVRQQLAT